MRKSFGCFHAKGEINEKLYFILKKMNQEDKEIIFFLRKYFGCFHAKGEINEKLYFILKKMNQEDKVN